MDMKAQNMDMSHPNPHMTAQDLGLTAQVCSTIAPGPVTNLHEDIPSQSIVLTAKILYLLHLKCQRFLTIVHHCVTNVTIL